MTRTTSTTRRAGAQHSPRRPLGDGASASSVERRSASTSKLRVRAREGSAAGPRRAAATTTPADAMRRALTPTPASAEELAALWAMTAAERVQAMWRGELSLAQLCKWSSRRPREVPIIAGEFAWIVIRTPAWAEAQESRAQNEPGGTS